MNFIAIVYSACISILIACLIYYMIDNTKLKNENMKLNVSLQTQNKTIQQQKIELENYVCDIDSMKAYALKEYQKAFNKTKNDTTCEGKVKHLENILKSYED